MLYFVCVFVNFISEVLFKKATIDKLILLKYVSAPAFRVLTKKMYKTNKVGLASQ